MLRPRLPRLPALRLPRVRPAAPAAMVVATVLVGATGASAVTMRVAASAPHPQHVTPIVTEPTEPLSLPPLPGPAAPPPGADATTPAPEPVDINVPRPKHLVDSTLLVTTARPLSRAKLRAIRHLSGVRSLQTVAAGRVAIDGHRSFVLGVDPATFRPWTPKLTAASQPLWQSIARGELTASFDMGKDAKLPLGETVPVRAAHSVPLRIGAFASVGMSGVDAVVSTPQATALGLAGRTGVIVSAPHADLLQLRSAVKDVVGSRAHAWLLRQMVVVRDAGSFLTRAQINTVLQAAAGRVGKPYVWGATGPDSFDCSGLVQWAFAHAGVRMPRVSQQQFYAGPHVPYSDARAGDLLFWHYDPTDPNNVDHVAIYAGNGMMLVAPHTGDFVKYVAVPLNNLAGVVRVDPGIAAQIG